MHRNHFFISEQAFDVTNDVSRIVVRNKRTPACSNTFTTIDEDHRYDRSIPTWLYGLPILFQVVKEDIICFREESTCNWG
jgi:hypothetical protein